MKNPESKYQRTTTAGPCHPTKSDSFLENRTISRVGFEKLEYIVESEFAHFSISLVNLWSGLVTLLSRLPS